jgi:hypothetical protein
MTEDVSAAFKRYFVQSRRSSGSNAFASPINIKNNNNDDNDEEMMILN